MNNKSLHHNNPLRFLLRCAVMMAVMLAWMMPAKAQTDYSGVYYIANAIWNGSNTGSEYYWYNVNTPDYNWYLVPGADSHLQHYSDAYFNDQYSNTNCGDAADYTGSNYGDPEKPFLTTYRTNRDSNSIWIVKKTGDYYYIIHALTGKYVKYERTYKSFPTRKTMHLEDVEGGNPGDVFKYEITENSNSAQSITGFNIRVKNLTSGDRYFNPAGDNWPRYYGTQDGNKKPYSSGMVGIYKSEDNASPLTKGSLWPHEDAKAVLTPTIGELDPSTNTVTITPPAFMPANSQLVYTTDGTDPSASNGTTYSTPITVTATTTIKAAVVGYGMVLSNIASKEITIFTLDQPTFEITCDNKLEIICSNLPNGGQIRYTVSTDGTVPADPTSSSTLYEDPITLAAGDKVKAIAFYSTFESVVSAVHTHAFTHTAPPTIVMTNATTITITGPSGSTIYYTTNGVDPEIGASGVTSHSSPVTVTINPENSVDIRALAKTSSLEASCVARLVTIGAPTITISEDDCSTASPRGNVVTIPIPDEGTIWYAVTAGQSTTAPDPNATPNPYSQYTEPVTIDDLDGPNTHYTIHAYAKSNDGSFNSPVTSESHEMKTGGKPVLTEPSGSNPVVGISGGVFGDVAICSATGVATQQITIASDGTAEYTITPEATGTLTVAFKHGNWLTSCEATYTLPSAPATPTWSQDCASLLSLHCATPMADIHYTTNDTEPTLESLTYVAGCLDAISVGTIIRAKAFIGFRASGELSFTYNPTHSTAPQFFVDGTDVVISVPGHANATIYYNFSTNGDNTMPSEPGEVSTTNYQYQSSTYTLTGVTIFSAIAVYDDLLPSCPVRVVTRPGYSINNAERLNLLSQHTSDYFFIFDDIDASGYTTTVANFTGVIEGNNYTISNLTAPLFGTATDAVIHDLTLDNVQIDVTTADANVGAFACKADGNARIYNCGIIGENSSVSGTKYVGGLVGLLDGSARVINCFSYADITGGTHRAGIVGYNNYASKSGDLKTMVMNCMFYGDISTAGSATIYPVYGGKNIHNKRAADDNTGLNNYCYFYYHGDYVNHINKDDYHGSLGAEERFLNRFEFFRQTLNSTRNMAAYYISGDATETQLVAKWVLDTDIAPYPILKAPGYYPSLVNFDAEHAVPIDPDTVHYNEGRKLGTLTVNIQLGSGGAHFNNTGAGVSLNETTLTLNVIDKDPNKFNFNYKKVQLPYYNQVGDGNYTNNRVVTGWKIVEINGSSTGTGNFVNTGTDAPAFNFVDRACSNKDLYSVSGRVFNQGAYWEVPDGVTSITIEPYWAKAVYLSDANYDVTYNGNTKYGVTVAGACPTSFVGQDVYNAIAGAIEALAIETDYTVYDYAVVLVGNYHQYSTTATLYSTTDNKPVTFMSADLDGDCEPDYTLFYYHKARLRVAPIRFDFLNMPGVGMVKRTWDNNVNPQIGIFKPLSWFEVTNTVLLRCGQFEYCDGTGQSQDKLYNAPLILQGGIYEQFVSSKNNHAPDLTPYLLIGGNAWFKNFANGCHTDNDTKTHNMPINVAGGDYEKFYLSGYYRPSCPANAENAECYIDGGRFGEVAGAGMQEINGNVTWLINAADVEKFFGGGINPAKFIKGDVTTTISNSRVTEFYGGPKFGEMQDGKDVTTTATNCRFGLFFGAGHGGTAYNRVGCEDKSANTDTPPWSTYVGHYTRSYEDKHVSHNSSGGNVNNDVYAISTSYEYEYILHSDGEQTVARFFVNFASLSLASTKDVVTNLTGCTIGTFYGGGRLGAVEGNVNSTLTDCTVEGDVFGSGFSAETPSLLVMNKANFVTEPKYNRRAGVFNDAQVEFPASIQYYWKHTDTPIATISPSTDVFEDDGDNHYILTNENLDNLGAVLGNTTLTINGNKTVILGDVYGGGALSSTDSGKTIQVNINEGTYGVNNNGTVTGGNIYGGGKGDLASLATTQDPNHANIAVTEGNVQLKIGNNSQSANSIVINGNVYGCNNYNGSPQGNVSVDVYVTKHNSSNTASGGTGYAIANVFGGGHLADYTPEGKKAYVTIHGCENTIGRVFGGGDAAAAPGVVTVIEGGRYDWVFGGGNGEVTAANIDAGGADISVHGGTINHLFGGSNQRGTIAGAMVVNVDNTSGCGEYVDEFFGGCNLVDLGTQDDPITLSTIIGCGTYFGSVYGGSNKADIYGDVTLTIEGGEIENVYGGSKGVAVGDTQYPQGISADISGDVTLNLVGGTIENAFGGSNVLGSIGRDITVNVEDAEDPDCPLVLTNVFGGGNLAVYGGTPAVNVKHGTVLGNVYGGGNGDPTNQTKGSTGAPTVTIGDDEDTHTAVVVGDVYGGGNAAKVTGNVAPTVQVLNKCNTEIGYVYGGGNAADVPATNVTIAGGTIHHDVFGGGHGDKASLGGVHTDKQANVDGDVSVIITGAKVDRVFAGANLNGSIGGTMTLSIDKSADANCNMIIREVYGGGNMADGDACPITIGCTGSIVAGENGHVAHPENIGTTLEGIGTLYGGANEANIGTSENHSDITVDINSGIVANVFGGNNTSGTISGTITVNIDKDDDASCASDWYVGNVYGGGDHAAYSGSPDVNIQNGTVSGNVFGGGNDITTANAGIINSDVEMTGGTVLGGVYGGCKEKGTVTGNSVVNILGGTIGSSEKLNNNNTTDVFGGGLGENTKVNGNVTVTISKATGENPPAAPTIYGDVYGGSALGEVNNSDNNVSTPTTSTTVNILDGLLKSNKVQTGTNAVGQAIYTYTGGNVFGGGKGRKANGSPAVLAKVYGPVSVNIGYGTPSPAEDGDNFTGNATIEGNVYGCNNTNGSPQQNVAVHIYRTAHTDGAPNNTINGDAYALANVFGGGNEADFQVEGKTATVNVYGCNNTIARTFGGGNAAASNEVFTMIQGGRIGEVFSGGNGEVSAANVNGNVNLTIHGGNIGQTFGGSNQQGFISGDFISTFDNEGPCEPMLIEDHYCGGKFADYVGNINATIQCSGGMNVRNLYGGCKQAHVVPKGTQGQSGYEPGNITLTVYGGTFENIYGGSEGTPTVGADITGDVTLNVYGGTVTHAIFGGSNIKGAIGGTITVNVEDKVTTDECPLDVSEADVYGGGNRADYPGVPQEDGPLYDSAHPDEPITHTSPFNYPAVNIKNATVKNVFGGGLNAEVTGNPQVLIKKGAKVLGNVYGGGNMGQVNGSPRVIVNGNLE